MPKLAPAHSLEVLQDTCACVRLRVADAVFQKKKKKKEKVPVYLGSSQP